MTSTETKPMTGATTSSRRFESRRRAGVAGATVGSTALFAYLSLATELGLAALRLRSWMALCVAALVGVLAAASWMSRRPRWQRFLPAVALLSAGLLIGLMTADLLYNLALNLRSRPLPFAFSETMDTGALEVHRGLPRHRGEHGGRNKPLVVIGGNVFGELVPPLLADDPEFRDLVLEHREVEYRLDERGYRNPLHHSQHASAVALGDSFVFGASIAEPLTWVRRLESPGRAIYNLGESGTGPIGQFDRFQEFLAREDAAPLETVIWMIFGGNDLAPDTVTEFAADASSRLDGTVLSAAIPVLEAVRESSILARLREGRLTALTHSAAYYYQNHLLPAPLYRSPQLGAKLFYQPYIDQAGRSAADVLADPMLPRIEKAFARMRESADQRGFEVLVVYAPSAEQVCGAHFTGFPAVQEPALASWVGAQAVRLGFGWLDLSERLAQGCESELPYFRDDTHWNALGHRIAADAISEHLENSR